MVSRTHPTELSEADFNEIRQAPIVTSLWPCILMGAASWLALFALYQWLS